MNPTEIILHCAATKENSDFSINNIDEWHKKRGFKKVGYHYVIRLDGTIETGRSENEIGAHCLKHNDKSIGICYIGGVDEKGNPKDTRTQQQKESMYKLVNQLMERYSIPLSNVYGHYQFANKACPSFKIEDFRKEYEEWLDLETKV